MPPNKSLQVTFVSLLFFAERAFICAASPPALAKRDLDAPGIDRYEVRRFARSLKISRQWPEESRNAEQELETVW